MMSWSDRDSIIVTVQSEALFRYGCQLRKAPNLGFRIIYSYVVFCVFFFFSFHRQSTFRYLATVLTIYLIDWIWMKIIKSNMSKFEKLIVVFAFTSVCWVCQYISCILLYWKQHNNVAIHCKYLNYRSQPSWLPFWIYFDFCNWCLTSVWSKPKWNFQRPI